MEKMLMKCDCGGKAVWSHPQDGVGIAICEKCNWIVAAYTAYNCPYIPMFVVEEKNGANNG